MKLEELIASITPETYRNLRRAVELGKWVDGARLSREQLENCVQTIIAYDTKNLPAGDRVGYIDRGSKEQGETCSDPDDTAGRPEESSIRFIDK
jgi:uncharacterized protein YeaC (DUF1315 family)